ncbi:fimbrial protein [Bordetella genomosp. 12]|uniref:Fimbrial-type adhesion domain-containing protein n=1 Tax=Bordetella genomosp. 12 TaxID=463035 RepID=A0A261VT81_9BORD|nr:fimbrial protein [Bordetella genomosp. 12]OZI77305.1 hypothetical protein CAL22_01790 [Bordetella genomosp. 12]
MPALKPLRAGARPVVLTLLAAAASLVSMHDARAACAVNPGGTGPATGTTYERYDPNSARYPLSPPQTIIAAPSNPTPGQILMRMTKPLPTYSGGQQGRGTAYYGCTQGTVENFAGAGALVAGFSDVYSTGLQGIGYRVAYYMQSGDPNSAVFAPQSYANPYANGVLYYPFGGGEAGPSLETMIELVATGGPVGLGTISASQVYGQSTVAGAPATQLYKVYLASSITVANPTCDTTSAALTLTLPDVSTTTLLRDGEGPKTDLTFSVACNVPSTISPSITIASSHLVAGTQNTLANMSSAANKAEGVGIDVWLGSPTPGGGYTAPTFGLAHPDYGVSADGASPTSLWSFRIAANLKQIGANNTVRAGPVTSTATLTFTYN